MGRSHLHWELAKSINCIGDYMCVYGENYSIKVLSTELKVRLPLLHACFSFAHVCFVNHVEILPWLLLSKDKVSAFILRVLR